MGLLCSACSVLYAILGLLALRLTLGVYRHFIRPGKDLKKYGQWAIITGCTDGIGLALSRQLAKRKLNLVLISRTQEKLREQAESLEKEFQIQTKILPIDFKSLDSKQVDEVKKLAKELDVGLLINNVGMSFAYPEFFHAIDDQLITDLYKLNVESTVALTRAVLPELRNRKRGAIVNISSSASLLSAPLLSVYAATKGYVDKFSEALYWEVSRDGVDVQVQQPWFVVSKLSKIRKASLLIPSADTFAKASLKQIGYEPVTSPYWAHALLSFVFNNIPASFRGHYVLKENLATRKRAQKKLQEGGAKKTD